jgi:hypothetical protein
VPPCPICSGVLVDKVHLGKHGCTIFGEALYTKLVEVLRFCDIPVVNATPREPSMTLEASSYCVPSKITCYPESISMSNPNTIAKSLLVRHRQRAHVCGMSRLQWAAPGASCHHLHSCKEQLKHWTPIVHRQAGKGCQQQWQGQRRHKPNTWATTGLHDEYHANAGHCKRVLTPEPNAPMLAYPCGGEVALKTLSSRTLKPNAAVAIASSC